MTPRPVLVNVLGMAFIAFCLYLVVGHMRYLSKSGKPSREVIGRELDEVILAFPGEKSSDVEVFEKQSFYISARVQMRQADDVLATKDSQSRMESHGWRKVRAPYGDLERYCKGDLVAEIAPSGSDGSYALQVNWGNADAVCDFK
jgi:hypothetical protein